MEEATLLQVKQDLLELRFQRATPAKHSEYWLFGGSAASAEGLRMLPSLFGLSWAWQDAEIVVDFIDGPDSGESDLLTWPEFVGIAAIGHRVLVRWAGVRLPVRVIVCPGAGVRVSIEHMDEGELRMLHHCVVERFVQQAIERMHESAVLIGCDTRGIANAAPERLVGYGSGLPVSILCPDFLLTHRSLAHSGVVRDSHQIVQAYDGMSLLHTSGP
jgi:hypothetical protein